MNQTEEMQEVLEKKTSRCFQAFPNVTESDIRDEL